MEIDVNRDKEIDYMTNLIYNGTGITYDTAHTIAERLYNFGVKPTHSINFGDQNCNNKLCKKCLLSVFDHWSGGDLCYGRYSTPREIYASCDESEFGIFKTAIENQLNSTYKEES